MREMSIREANQNFSRLIAMAEAGETIIITRNGKRVATLTPAEQSDLDAQAALREQNRAFRAAMRARKGTGFRVGTITEDDKYGED